MGNENEAGTIQTPTRGVTTGYARPAYLATRFPCCGEGCRLRYVKEVPRETYERRCSRCGQKWDVERRTAKEGVGARLDIVNWTPEGALSIEAAHALAKSKSHP